MEIEKKRETSWKIQLKKSNDFIELTSVEVSGEVRLMKLCINTKKSSAIVELRKNEFYKFLSLISAFKDVVIGEDSILSDDLKHDNSTISVKYPKIPSNNKKGEDSITSDYIKKEPNKESAEIADKSKDAEELNPKDWDPW